jgi:hypothetical protein
MIIERLTAEHLHAIDLHEEQQEARRFWSADYERLLLTSPGYAAVDSGRVLLCGGVLDLYPDRRAGHVWSLTSRYASAHFLRLHRATRRFFETSGKRLLVATTYPGGTAGCRWLSALGFQFDHTEPNYDPLGREHAVYVRVQ